jgi:tRNA modification GTPase
MLEQIDDTIVAISSPPGRSAVGIVRLTGRDAIAIVGRLADTTEPLARRPASTHVEGAIRIAPDLPVPARFYVFRAPRSYTREDLVEIHTVAAPVVLEMIRRETIALGAKPAAAGAFTARALIHGAIDLPRAEAVARLIHAQTDAQLRAARQMMDGSLGRNINQAREALAELLALVEADIDFAEEPIEFITPEDLRDRLGEIERRLADLSRRAVSSERVSTIPHILLLGPPNAGKSTLLNALTSTRRAICAAVAGTTRDLLAAPIRLGRGEAILLDSAGVDRSQDEILRHARTLTIDAAQRVDLVCIVLDASAPPDKDFIARARALDLPDVLVVANKCDRLAECGTGFQPVDCGTGFQPVGDRGPLAPEDQTSPAERGARRLGLSSSDWPICAVSALVGTGLDALRKALADRIQRSPASVGAEAVVLGERQRAGVDDAVAAIRRAMQLAAEIDETIDRADVIAFELREAVDALGTVSGAVTTEDLLTKIFANFCIGK